MKKSFCICLCALLFSLSSQAQKEHYFSIGGNTGGGATIRVTTPIVIETFGFGGKPGAMHAYHFNFYSYGFHIPLCIAPIMYGTARWRVGGNLTYEYFAERKLRYPNFHDIAIGYSFDNYQSKSVNNSFHSIKVGVLFQYDFWQRNKSTLGLASEFGYHAYLGNQIVQDETVNPNQYPHFYGSLGLQASYDIVKGLKIVYGICMDIQAGKAIAFSQANDIYYQPRLTIGIRKDFALASKKKK